jgi:ectoine hydroxylase-related dioxygenase (phytanoyl-CoA dioxygenase family)
MILTPDQQRTYRRDGILFGIPVYTGSALQTLQEIFAAFKKYPEEGEDGSPLSFRLLREEPIWRVATHPTILGSVDDILGSDFYVWAARFFNKDPRSTKRVVWHQDSAYWPLEPACSVTVWLAVHDVTRQNAAMRVIPGSQKRGALEHATVSGEDAQHGSLEILPGLTDESLAIDITLRAGEISLHDSQLVHGSPYNESPHPRCGLTIRYSRSDVQCDRTVWPRFEAHHLRARSRSASPNK